MSAQEIQIEGRVSLSALRFNAGAGMRALALHGWLDNAMSFAALAGQMPEVEITALEFAGHGRCDHLPAGTFYHFVDYCGDVLAALEQLGDPPDFILAHSLGGAVATAFAAALPDRVKRLVLLEALGPISGGADRATLALRNALLDRARLGDKQLRLFASVADAVAARLSANRMAPSSAEALMQRGLRAVPGGFLWASDPRLTLDTPIRLGEDVVEAWIDAIACPTLVIVGEEIPAFFPIERQQARFARLRQGTLCRLPGRHHLHMDDPAPAAAAIRAFVS
ncbi:MAG: alpha/beta fold hydrolase [Xanthomonadales bacterium]|nr:alpha/beta fold hydrolase [Xanthomonadales bacterium]